MQTIRDVARALKECAVVVRSRAPEQSGSRRALLLILADSIDSIANAASGYADRMEIET